MQVVVLHGTLTETEQDSYICQATALYPVSIIERWYATHFVDAKRVAEIKAEKQTELPAEE